ncbi:MAG: hypothetical protein ABEI52_12185 [Halobacteriaceae archaeon]
MANADPLETWTIATGNVVLFGVVGVLTVHLSGALADILQAFGTLRSEELFGYLWTLVVVATRWALTDSGLAQIDHGEISQLVLRGAIGAGFLLGLVVVGGLASVASGGIELVSVALIGLIGGFVSAVVGAIIGVVFVLVDSVLYHVVPLLLLGPEASSSD